MKVKIVVKIYKNLNYLNWVLVLTLASFMFARSSTFSYSPDSWSYVDISRGLIDKERTFGEVLGTRDYSNVPWQNDSFPFLWPYVLSLGILIFGPSSPVGGYIFIGIWILTGLVMFQCFKQFRIEASLAPFLFLSILTIPGYLNEGHSGRSIPLNVFFLACSLLLIFRGKETPYSSVGLGILLGMCAINRFDSLLYGPIFLACAYSTKIMKFRNLLISLATWSLFPILWILYSIRYLNGFYVTDNNRVGLSSVNANVTDWPINHKENIIDIWSIFVKAIGNIEAVGISFISAFWLWAIIFLASLAAILLLFQKRESWLIQKSKKPEDFFKQNNIFKFLSLLTLSFFTAQFFILLFSGYGDKRYWANSSFILLNLIILSHVNFRRDRLSLKCGLNLIKISTSKILLIVLGIVGTFLTAYEYRSIDNQGLLDYRLVKCLNEIEGAVIIPGIEGYRIPAITNFRVATPPHNSSLLSSKDWLDMSNEYGITTWVRSNTESDTKMPLNARGVLVEYNCNRS